MPLEEHYIGDAAWNKFARLHKANSRSGDPWNPELAERLAYRSPAGKEALIVANSILGSERLVEWWHDEIPALDFATPSQCTESEILLKRLRECLMRFPV